MYEFLCSEAITLRILDSGLSDGMVRYHEKAAMAIVIENRGFTRKNGASAAVEFLIPGQHELAPGSQIVWRGTVYDVAGVKQCRDLSGFSRAIRCTIC